MDSSNNSTDSLPEIPSIWLNILCYSVAIETSLFFLANVCVLAVYMLNSSKFSNPYYLTMKLMCLWDACLLLIIFLYSLNNDWYYLSVFSFMEEFAGYSQIVSCNLVNCINRFLAIVFFYHYKTWVTKKRMIVLLFFCVIWNLVASIFHAQTDYSYYSYYDYVRTGGIMLGTNLLYWVSFFVSLKRMSSMTGDAKKVMFTSTKCFSVNIYVNFSWISKKSVISLFSFPFFHDNKKEQFTTRRLDDFYSTTLS